MTHRNPFLEELRMCQEGYDATNLDIDLRAWNWKNGCPPRDEIIGFMYEHRGLVSLESTEARSSKNAKLQRLKEKTEDLQDAIPRPLTAGREFTDAWAAEGRSIDDHLALFSLLETLKKTCLLAMGKGQRRNTAKADRWLGESLLTLFEEQAVLRPGDRPSEEGPSFVRVVADALGVALPSSQRSYSPSRRTQNSA